MVGPGNSGRGGGHGGYQRRDNYQRPAGQEVQPLPAAKLPEDFVDAAESVVKGLMHPNKNGQNVIDISNSKIRRIFSLVVAIFNKERLRTEEKLAAESKSALMMARVRIAYEAGREKTVKEFVEAAKLLEYIKGAEDDREQFIRLAQYMEALVAWHRYYGDKD